jgi:hypothetical protein
MLNTPHIFRVPVLAVVAAAFCLTSPLAIARSATAKTSRCRASVALGRHHAPSKRARHRSCARLRGHRRQAEIASSRRQGGPVPPATPQDLTATPGDGQVTLAWTAAGTGARYRVYRDGAQAAQVTKLSYVDSGRTNGATYRYNIVAINAFGQQVARSAVVSATPTAGPGVPPSTGPGVPPSTGPGDPPATSQSWTCGWGSFSGASSAVNLPSGCWRPFADSSWLNTPLPANPRLLSNSATLVANMMSPNTGNGDGTVHALHPIPSPTNDYDHPYFFSSASDPLYTISCARNCNLAGQNVNGQSVHIPCGARPADGSDHHLAVIDQIAGVEWDFWAVETDLSRCAGGTLRVGLAGQASMSGDGTGSCADAVCTALTAGIIREQELASGRIEHALFMVDHTCNGTTVYPGWTPNTCGGTNSTAPAVGQWFKLDLTPSQIQTLSGISDWQKTILTAVSVYGMFVGDQGSNGAFELQTDSPATYAGTTNPWIGWASGQTSRPNNNIDSGGGTLSLKLGAGLPANFWASHLQAVDPCVIKRTC